jgi:hypothetical protein
MSTTGAPDGWARWNRRVARLVTWLSFAACVGVLGLFAGLMVRQRLTHVPEIDSQGYFLMARSFSRLEWPRWEEDFPRYQDHVWVGVGENRVTAKYAPGWPLLLAVGYRLGGLEGSFWVNPVAGILAAVFFCLLAWQLFGPVAAAICSFVWLFSPMVPCYSNYLLTHSVDLMFVMLAFLAVVSWARHGGPRWAGVAGFAAGYLPLIRPANVLMWPALALIAIAVAREQRGVAWASMARGAGRLAGGLGRTPRRWWRDPAWAGLRRFVLGAVLPLGFLALYNWVSFGAPWRTGYALTDEQQAFQYADLGRRLLVLLAGRRVFLEDKYWVLVLLGLLWRPGRPWLLAAFLAWFVPMLVVHTGYYFFMPSGPFTRFLVAALPAVVLCIGFLCTGALWRSPWMQLVLLVAAGAWCRWSPPEFFHFWGELQAGRKYTYDELRADQLLNLTNLLHHMGQRREPVDRVRQLIGNRPAAIYSSDITAWTIGSLPRAINYDLEFWESDHFLRPMAPYCARRVVWGDRRRHARMHEWAAARGASGVQADLIEHVRADLAAGREVWFAGGFAPMVLGWVRAASGLAVSEEIPGQVWRVRLAAGRP